MVLISYITFWKENMSQAVKKIIFLDMVFILKGLLQAIVKVFFQ